VLSRKRGARKAREVTLNAASQLLNAALETRNRDPVALPEPLALYTPAGLYTLNSDSVALPAALLHRARLCRFRSLPEKELETATPSLYPQLCCIELHMVASLRFLYWKFD